MIKILGLMKEWPVGVQVWSNNLGELGQGVQQNNVQMAFNEAQSRLSQEAREKADKAKIARPGKIAWKRRKLRRRA